MSPLFLWVSLLEQESNCDEGFMRHFSFLTLTIVILMGWMSDVHASASGLRAQGRYYTAKEAYEQRRYDDAARLLKESRDMLGGKSNRRLQYLLVMSLYNAKRFRDAQTEMNFYLELESDAKGRYMSFPQDVDALTGDETRAITMLIDKIDSEVASGAEDRIHAAAEREAIFRALNDLLVREYVTNTDTRGGKAQPEVAKLTSSGSHNAWRLTGEVSRKRYSDAFDGPGRWVIDSEYRRITVTIDLAAVSSYRIEKAYYGTDSFNNGYMARHGVTTVIKDAASGTNDFLILSFSNLQPYEYRLLDEIDSRGNARFYDLSSHKDYGFAVPIKDVVAAKQIMERLLRANGL